MRAKAGQEALDVLDHLPHAAGADACAEAAADALVVVDHILVRAVRMLGPADGAPIARGFAHVTITAGRARHAPVRLFDGRNKISATEIIVFRFDPLVGDELFDLGPARRMHQLVVDRLCRDSSLADRVGHETELGRVSDRKDLHVGGLSTCRSAEKRFSGTPDWNEWEAYLMGNLADGTCGQWEWEDRSSWVWLFIR